MKLVQAFVLVLPAFTAAFPGMAGSRTQMEDFFRAEIAREAAEKREADPQILNLVGNLVGALGDTVSGLLNSVKAAIVVQDNLRPEPGFEFREPGPGDSRGPCPGLNLLANHGYLPRNGYVNQGQVIEATARGFNMGTDLSTILTVFAVLSSGDIDGLSFYLGSGKNGIGGLNRHSTVEADISPNREGKSSLPHLHQSTLTTTQTTTMAAVTTTISPPASSSKWSNSPPTTQTRNSPSMSWHNTTPNTPPSQRTTIHSSTTFPSLKSSASWHSISIPPSSPTAPTALGALPTTAAS